MSEPTRTLHGRWLTDQGWVDGVCTFSDKVHKIQQQAQERIVPSFIPAPVDLHVHGGGGADVMQGESALRTVLHAHGQHGTGALLATSVTAPFDAIDEFLVSVGKVMNSPSPGCAHLLGAHLEGPFINPDKLGAQPDYPAALDLAVLEKWLQTGVVKVITYAPELDESQQVLALCARYGVRAQLGHTLCSWAQARVAIANGAGITHLFNAMSPVSHRGGGAALAALAFAEFAEIITDGIHVDEAAFNAARRAISGLYSVTDATAATGMPDGTYQLGSLQVRKCGDRVLLPDGTLAGSCLTQQRSIQVLQQWGLDWQAIARLCSSVPASWLSLGNYGVIGAGAYANWIEVDEHQATAIWLDGQRQLLEQCN